MTIFSAENFGPSSDSGEVAALSVAGRGDRSESECGGVPVDNTGRLTADLVRASASGDQEAWDLLVERFAATVWAVASGYGLSTADAADVSQVTWLRLVEQLDRIEQPERVGTWLAATARRESLRALGLAGRQVPTDDDLGALAGSGEGAPDRDLLGRPRDRVVIG